MRCFLLVFRQEAGAGAACAELEQPGDLCPARMWDNSLETHTHHYRLAFSSSMDEVQTAEIARDRQPS